MKKMGFIDENGDIFVDTIKTKFKENSTAEDVDNVVTKCAVKKETPQETASHFFKCIHEHKYNHQH